MELILHENRQIKTTYFYKHNFKLCVKLKEKHQQTQKITAWLRFASGTFVQGKIFFFGSLTANISFTVNSINLNMMKDKFIKGCGPSA